MSSTPTNPEHVRIALQGISEVGTCNACRRHPIFDRTALPTVHTITLGDHCTTTVRLCPDCLEHLRLKAFPPQADAMETLMKDTSAWAESTFPGQSTAAKAEHLVREAQELLKTPWDSEEMADVLLLLLHIANRAGVNLLEAARRKLEVNKKRKWGPPDDSGVYHHVKAEQINAEACPSCLSKECKCPPPPSAPGEVVKEKLVLRSCTERGIFMSGRLAEILHRLGLPGPEKPSADKVRERLIFEAGEEVERSPKAEYPLGAPHPLPYSSQWSRIEWMKGFVAKACDDLRFSANPNPNEASSIERRNAWEAGFMAAQPQGNNPVEWPDHYDKPPAELAPHLVSFWCEGYAQGFQKLPRKCPYAGGTYASQTWHSAYDQGYKSVPF